MKKAYNISITLLFLLLTISGCNDDPTLTIQEEVQFSDNITLSADNVVLLDDNAVKEAINISWPAVSYAIDAPVTYTVQFARNGQWAEAVSRIIGFDILSISIETEDLNAIAIELGIQPNAEGVVDIRVEAYLNQRVHSLIQNLTITTYSSIVPYINYPSIYIAGDFQGWIIEESDSISSTEDNGIYEGYIYIPAGGTNEFKLYTQKDWGSESYGDGGGDTVIVANYAGDNFIAPSEGYYLFAIDLNTMKYLLKKIDSWGIMGEATPDGWNSDTNLTFDPSTQLWSLTADMKATGFFKFRANDAWEIDMGLDEDGNFLYGNHPWLPYEDRTNLTIENSGMYTITLDLTVPGNYRYSVKAN